MPYQAVLGGASICLELSSGSDLVTPGFISRASSTSEYGMWAGQSLGGFLQEGLALCHLVPSYLCFPALVPGTRWTHQEMSVEQMINLPSYL